MALIEYLILRPLWRAIKPELTGIVDRSLSGIVSKSRALLAGSLNDAFATVDAFLKRNPRLLIATGQDTIQDRRGRDLLRINTIPLSILLESQAIRSSLAEAIRANPELEAAKNKLNMSADDLQRISDKYAGLLLRHGLRMALTRAAKADKQLAGKLILAVENEAYPVDGESEYRDVVKLVSPGTKGAVADIMGDPRALRKELKQAKKIWRSRTSLKYDRGGFSTAEVKQSLESD